MSRKLTGLTVAELREQLEDMDPSAIVLMISDYGDHCHTAQALPIKDVEEIDEADLEETAYSNSGWALNTGRMDHGAPDDGDERPTTSQPFVVMYTD